MPYVAKRQRTSSQKREREFKKRARERKKAEKAAQKRERRLNRGRQDSLPPPDDAEAVSGPDGEDPNRSG
ncbi:MAG: hypothetical protein JSU68_04570 [Phycisphaerales bacterium]|nr:MAG: hypothetical protein JSU68_04570 [Phycisphaerales bacterium]